MINLFTHYREKTLGFLISISRITVKRATLRKSKGEEMQKEERKGGNPSPVQNDALKQKQFKPKAPTWGTLGKHNFLIRLPTDIEGTLKELPQADRIGGMREALVLRYRAITKTASDIATEHGAIPDNLGTLAIGDRFVAGDGSVWEVWEDGEENRLYRLLLLGNKGEETTEEE